ncbi:MAG TPA: TonB-dependent receptor, partial [Candidatus Thermoplasmatota archaeon]
IPDRTSWTVDVAGGVDETLRLKARAGDATENLGWLVETYQIRTDGFKEMEGGRDTGFEIGDYLAKLRVNTDRDARTYQELELKLSFTDELSRETYLGLTSADFEVNPLRRYAASQADVMDAEHTQVQLRHFVRPSRAIDVTTTAYRNDFGRNWYKLQSVAGRGTSTVLNDPETYARELGILRGADSGPGELRVRANNREYLAQGVQSVLGVRGSTGALGHDLEIGVRLHEDQEDRFQHEDAYQMLGGTMVRTGSGAPGSQANRVSDARAVALYLQDRVRLGEWTVSPGVRYENVDFTRTDYETTDPERTAPKAAKENGVDVLIPGVGVSWEVAPAAHLFGGVHRGFSPPGPGAAADTEPEESVSYELGGRYRGRGVALQATAFLSDYSNILGRATLATGESGSGDLYNGGEVDVSGVELSLDVDPAWGTDLPVRLPVRLAYTLTRAEFGTAFESAYEPWGTVEVGDELPYIPEHQLSGSVGVEGSGWTVALSGFGSTAMRAVAGQGPIEDGKGTDGFAVFSLSAEYVLPRGGTIYGSIQNLFDDAYVAARRPAGARPGLPRTLLVGYRLSR